MNCPECGALGDACEARYQACLVKEFTDAQYGAVHHLTVAAYMLQHSSRLTPEGWLYEREILREFLLENKPPAIIRKQHKAAVDSGRRSFKITSVKAASLATFSKRAPSPTCSRCQERSFIRCSKQDQEVP
jgi:hypothetical protein